MAMRELLFRFFSRPISLFPSKSPHLTRFYQIQAFLITSGLLQTPIWADKVLKHSLDLAGIDYTVSIFRVLNNPDSFCVNAVIKGYSISSIPSQALVFYFQMLENGGFVPNSYSFVPLIGSCAKMRCFESGGKCHGQAVKNGVDSVLTVQNSLIHMYGCCGKIGYAEKVFAEMPMRDVYSWNSILEAHVKIGDLVLARKVFDAMPERSVVSWNIMIGGYSKGGSPGNALKLFRTMAAMEGIRGNEATMASILSSCRRSARLKEGRSVHGFLIKNLGKSNLVIEAALIDMYSKCHKVELARSSIFDKMGYRNVVCWNSMVLGHCIHGQPEDGLELFAEMVVVCPPDEITFVGVLCACARAGLVTEGTSYFDQMVNVFSIKPNFGHFWCMANLYASAGMVEEAEEVLRNNISEGLSSSQSLLWANLLTSCRFRGDVAIGERIAMSLIEKDPGNFSYYQFLLNIYDSAGRLEDANRVKKMMNGRRIPGCNLVDLKEIVHDLRAAS